MTTLAPSYPNPLHPVELSPQTTCDITTDKSIELDRFVEFSYWDSDIENVTLKVPGLITFPIPREELMEALNGPVNIDANLEGEPSDDKKSLLLHVHGIHGDFWLVINRDEVGDYVYELDRVVPLEPFDPELYYGE
jgi:hypothetical protein